MEAPERTANQKHSCYCRWLHATLDNFLLLKTPGGLTEWHEEVKPVLNQIFLPNGLFS